MFLDKTLYTHSASPTRCINKVKLLRNVLFLWKMYKLCKYSTVRDEILGDSEYDFRLVYHSLTILKCERIDFHFHFLT